MSESGGIAASSLALATEKKPQKSGGCVGLFYQLFDWKRRFAKKNFFPKKLLPPDLCKQGSKKFVGEERHPKLRLIADENSGGFPSNMKTNKFCSVKSEKKNEMRPPGLVARLMGLDSMPAVSRDNKPRKVFLNDQSSSVTNEKEENKFGGEDGVFAKMRDFRPQKIQKTGTSERSPVTRFGAEALQIKNMLSRSKRKKNHHHHPKLASPLKSAKNVPGTRLIGVANKILDPRGMQRRSRGKYFLTSSDTLHPPSSCRNCGHSLDIKDSRPNQEQESFQIPCQDSETSVPKVSSYVFQEQKERRAFTKSSSHIIGPIQHSQKQNQMFPGGYNRVPERAYSISETKDAVALNKSINGCTRMRMPTKAERCDFETERRLSNRRAESLSPARKRRSMNVTCQNESSRSISLSSRKDYSMIGKEPSGSRQDSGIAPFTFRSPVDKRAALPRKSTTVILQELKSALTAERQFHKDGFNVRSNRNNTTSHPLDSSTKFLDTSLAKAKFYKPFVTGLSNSIAEVLQKSKLFYGYLKGCKLEYAKEVILNTELVVGKFSITRFVLEDLDTLACVIMMRYSDIFGFQSTKHENQFKRFVFDCVLEFLDSKCGFGAWTKLPPFMNTEMLVFEILEEVKLWAATTGLAHDELLEWDMNRSLGKWTGFDIEVLECSAEIGHQIVEKLVEEVVNDL
ncbi:unnamed protein product [Cuscuta campestris]|uniref:DUF4378 domain-containing protein n=1 Tax=Cuscuta campestris TaxID=132261 RepID=A0A484LG59_9ASTE|nr:unnamed protein product [Cuscuta campestris]